MLLEQQIYGRGAEYLRCAVEIGHWRGYEGQPLLYQVYKYVFFSFMDNLIQQPEVFWWYNCESVL